uniref:Uncharacterized protein n=1 Tax=Oryza brachyantha TaxID=4533 RepID=J3MD90_ORYBR
MAASVHGKKRAWVADLERGLAGGAAARAEFALWVRHSVHCVPVIVKELHPHAYWPQDDGVPDALVVATDNADGESVATTPAYWPPPLLKATAHHPRPAAALAFPPPAIRASPSPRLCHHPRPATAPAHWPLPRSRCT